ncbi:universal stress protein [Actinophytocola gossypii]|uniref:Universal stress protein n=1 Tax=Actinophytocola gossypii TaxID=2812003 RepID=A0ABT2J803_9PSEU|nr:universal stress protein [Actinophytocola gossypii]MCT2583419.1 universal stress protein [Actinophytocola gossypii]
MGADPAGAFESTVEHFGPRSSCGRTILAGVDGSDTSMRAASYAFGLARREGYRLLVALVRTRWSLALTGPAMEFERHTFVRLRDELRDEVREHAEELGVAVTFLVVHGDPSTSLRETADQCQVDTVVVGASTSAGHRFAGSVANRLIRAGRWPVVVVP